MRPHGRSPADQFCQKVVPHLNRVRLLYLSLREGDCDQILGSLEAGRAVLLREFSIQKRFNQWVESPYLGREDPLFRRRH